MRFLALLFLPLILACGEEPLSSGSSGGQPTVIWLHGRTPPDDIYRLDFEAWARGAFEREGYHFIAPVGHTDPADYLFWDAVWCCNVFNQNVDSVAYVLDIIKKVNPKGPIFVIGYSNGGGLAHLLMGEAPEIFSAAISIAGAGYYALEIHGRNDMTVPFLGGQVVLGWTPPGTELPDAPPAASAPELWEGPWGHGVPVKEMLPDILKYLEDSI